MADMMGVVGSGLALGAVAATVGVSYGVARLAWRVRSQWLERSLQRKTDHLSSAIQDIAQAEVGADDDAS